MEEKGGKEKVEVVKKVRGPWDEDEDSDEEEEEEEKGEGEKQQPNGTEPPAAADEKPVEEEKPAVEEVAAEEEEEEEKPPKPLPLFDTAPLLKDDEGEDPATAFGAVTSLRLENCGLRGGALEVLGSSPHPFLPRLRSFEVEY